MLSLSVALVGIATASLARAGYAPSYTACNGTFLRLAGVPQQGNQALSSQEQSYVSSRRSGPAAQALMNYLSAHGSTVFSGSLNLSTSALPTLAIAVSGGGDRAALFGAGVLNALDSRNSSSLSSGLGGLLQSSTYISALSGGSWLMTSIIFNDFPSSFYDLVLGSGQFNGTGWILSENLLSPGTGNQTSQFFETVFNSIAQKKGAGNWNVTFADFWARSLAYHYLPGTTLDNFFDNTTEHAASILFSSAPSLLSWQNHTQPFPIFLSDSLSVNTTNKPLTGDIVPLQNIIYELSPYEFGSYDPALASFIPMSLLGTAAVAGTPVNGGPGGNCVTGFDNAGFITGCSSLVFSSYNQSNDISWTSPLSPIYTGWSTINSTFYSVQPNQELDIAAIPNPFKGIGSFTDVNQDQLRLIDGGYDGEVDPIAPLIVKARGVNFIFIVDAASDSNVTQPQGGSLVATVDRVNTLPNGTVTLPPMPASTDTYVAQGLNTRPTFFGCNGTAVALNGTPVARPYPMIVYLPNYDPAGVTNTSTSDLQFNTTQAQAFLDETTRIVTRGFSPDGTSADTQWPTCLACAVVESFRAETGQSMTSACEACFARYCWSEKENNGGSSGGGGNSNGNGGGGGSKGPATRVMISGWLVTGALAITGGLAVLG